MPRWILITLMLSSLPLGATPVSNGDPLWDASLRALESKDTPKAIEGFRQWIEEHARIGVQSPEAHYNLGLAYWDLKQPGPAVFQVLESTALGRSPIRLSQNLRTLASLEKEIGIKESVADQFLFQLWVLFNPDICLLLFAMGFWALVIAALWRWASRPSSNPWTWALFGGSLGCFVLAAFCSVNHTYLTHVGVLIGDGGVELYRLPQRAPTSEPETKADLKLAELPSGTIVTVGKSQEGFVQITQPVAGWVPSVNLKLILPASG